MKPLGKSFAFASMLFISCLDTIIAQDRKEGQYALSGLVIDEQDIPVPYASVALFSQADSTMLTGDATGDDGRFVVYARPGEYYMQINFLSYEEKLLPGIKLGLEDLDIGTITLISSSVALEEVQVAAERSQMQLHLDKRVFNVEKDISSRGANAAEILDNLPSINTDIEGNVSLRGSQNVRILIDGKPSGLAQANSLRQLQGSMIESVEVITNPSARYDAEGEVGIINIILKKERREGFNGSFEGNTGWPHNHGIGVNVNYRKGKVNLFSNYSLRYRSHPGNGHSLHRFSRPDTSYFYERFREHQRSETSNNFQLGTDIFLNDYNTLTLAGKYNHGDGTNVSGVTYNYFNEAGILSETIARDDVEAEIENELELALDYRKTFRQRDREWTASLQYSLEEETELSDINEASSDGTGPIFQMTSNEENEENALFQTDYVHPFGNEGKFEVGLKANFRTLENNYRLEERFNGEWVVDPEIDDNFVYQENIYAAYLIAGHKTGNLSYQGGLRMEQSNVKTELLRKGTKNSSDYLDLFPSVHFSYELAKQNTLQLSYSRRLSRPHFRHLLPFSSFSDNRNIRVGNPDLLPEYTHSIEFGHLKYFEKASILSSVYYRYRTNVVERIDLIFADTLGLDEVIITKPINLAQQIAYGLEFNLNFDPFQWWKLSGNFNFYRAITEGVFEGGNLESDTYTWDARGSSKMNLFNKVDFQLSFYYRAPHDEPQERDLASYSLDTGLAMDVLQGNGTIILSVRDVFNTRKWRSITETPEYYAESEFQWRSRSARISFTYRLNQKKKQEMRGEEGNFEGGEEGF